MGKAAVNGAITLPHTLNYDLNWVETFILFKKMNYAMLFAAEFGVSGQLLTNNVLRTKSNELYNYMCRCTLKQHLLCLFSSEVLLCISCQVPEGSCVLLCNSCQVLEGSVVLLRNSCQVPG